MNWKFLLIAVIVIFITFIPNTINSQTGWSITANLQYVGGNYDFDNYNKINFYYSGIGNWNISLSVPLIVTNNKLFYGDMGKLNRKEDKMASDIGNGGLIPNHDRLSNNYSLLRDASLGDITKENLFPQTLNLNTFVKLPTAVCSKRKGEYNYGFSVTISKLSKNIFGFGSLGYVFIKNPMHAVYINALSYGFGLGKHFYNKTLLLFLYIHSYNLLNEVYGQPRFFTVGFNYNLLNNISIYFLETVELSKVYSEFSYSYGLKWHL